MLNLVLKIFLAVVQALPAVIEAVSLQRAKNAKEKREADIEKDPYAEFEHKFGELQPDSHSDEARRVSPVPQTTSKIDSNDSPRNG